ncbi:MAG TPA: polymer-forming cytoskeletal protein [Pyrinomonadaceae bacterium]|nr:polymer-forming cytoskeletal protein [Pyrinomonadaceae bacterium]
MIAAQALPSGSNQILAATRNCFLRTAILLGLLVAPAIIGAAQPAASEHPGDPDARVIDGTVNATVFGMGRSIRITGAVKEGAISFGGDVIVEGTVEGDVAAIGGSVIQRAGARIGGDVIGLGGIYHHDKAAPDRDPKSVTIMYAGYEDQLRHVMREPFSVLHPQISAVFFGTRLLAILIWFVMALAITAVMPNTISRAVTRLQLHSLRVALIGLVGTLVITLGVLGSLWLLPSIVSAAISVLALLLAIIATVFGRVVIVVATGRWLQRKWFPQFKSESVMILLGVTFWIVLSSIPYVWPFVQAGLLVASLGLALTARYRVGWKTADRARA